MPPSTIRLYISEDWNAYDDHPRARPFLNPQQEADLVTFILWMADHSMPLTTTEVRDAATSLTQDRKPSLRWAQRFVQKHE